MTEKDRIHQYISPRSYSIAVKQLPLEMIKSLMNKGTSSVMEQMNKPTGLLAVRQPSCVLKHGKSKWYRGLQPNLAASAYDACKSIVPLKWLEAIELSCLPHNWRQWQCTPNYAVVCLLCKVTAPSLLSIPALDTQSDDIHNASPTISGQDRYYSVMCMRLKTNWNWLNGLNGKSECFTHRPSNHT